MAEVPPQGANPLEAEGFDNEQTIEREGNNPIIPEDGYGWKKYGQKFIKNIGKIRSYFKCQRRNCNAKKKAEWSGLDPTNVQVVYEGMHNHPSLFHESSSSQQQEETSSSLNNQYDLFTQVFGSKKNPP